MYVTYKGSVCCLDSLRESKQKSNFLVFSLAAQACGSYLALLDILSLSQYLMFAGFYLKRRFMCELVCRWFREDVHNIDVSRRCLSTYFHRCISQVPPFGAFS